MAMLTIPARSHSRPAMAPSAIGIARRMVPLRRPNTLTEPSRAAHVSSAATNKTRAIPNTR